MAAETGRSSTPAAFHGSFSRYIPGNASGSHHQLDPVSAGVASLIAVHVRGPVNQRTAGVADGPTSYPSSTLPILSYCLMACFCTSSLLRRPQSPSPPEPATISSLLLFFFFFFDDPLLFSQPGLLGHGTHTSF